MDWSASLQLSGKAFSDYGSMRRYWNPIPLRIPQSIPEETSINKFNSPGYSIYGQKHLPNHPSMTEEHVLTTKPSRRFTTFIICSVPITLLSFFLLILALRQLAPSSSPVSPEIASPTMLMDSYLPSRFSLSNITVNNREIPHHLRRLDDDEISPTSK